VANSYGSLLHWFKRIKQECNRASLGGQYVVEDATRHLSTPPEHPIDKPTENRAMRVSLPCALSMAVLCGFAIGAALRVTYAAEPPAANPVWSTKQVMDRVALGKQSLLAVVNKDLRNAEPDWKSDEENLREIIRLMSMLTKQKPLRGSQEAWDKLVQEYVDGARAARQNVREHRVEAARAALEKARSTCEECHDNHGIK
jgi:hypothetical protein